MKTYLISPSETIDFTIIEKIITEKYRLVLSDDAKAKINRCRDYLDKKISGATVPIYGVNTGFGALCNTQVGKNDLETLQKNLIVSHACGTGEEVPHQIVKLMLLLKTVGLSYGNSGVQLAVVERLIEFFNNDILPVVYQQGSLGASGDLAPLAHLSLPLLGLGEVYFKGEKRKTKDVYEKLNMHPVHLKAKEGLALINGTQFMSGFGVYCMLQSFRLSCWADIIAAISLDAFDGRMEPFHGTVHKIRPHAGQLQTAGQFRKLLSDSEIVVRAKQHVQDPYSFRCIPQVHGASKDSINYVASVLLTEINSVTDNPTVFPDEDAVISAGNFHGQPLAIALDFLAIALAELGNISERRIYQLISGQRGLPPFLAVNPGLNSGLMISQYTAASIVSQNKQLCTPASVDSIVSSNGQEDHVSMGANAATKCFRVANNLEKILAIELLTAVQALEFRRPMKTSVFLEKIISAYREKVPFIKEDRILFEDINASIDFLSEFMLCIE